MIKLFIDDCLLFLKIDPQSVRRGLKCNIEKSRLFSLTESDGFDYAGWIGNVVGKGHIFGILELRRDAILHQSKLLSGY